MTNAIMLTFSSLSTTVQVTYLSTHKDEELRKAELQRVKLREAYEQLASTSLLSGKQLGLVTIGILWRYPDHIALCCIIINAGCNVMVCQVVFA